jgi:hypothetical protein
MNGIAKLIYNPDIDKDIATPIMSNMYVDVVVGWIMLMPDEKVGWLFNRDGGPEVEAGEFGTFAQELGGFLDANDLRTACWDDSTSFEQILARLEHSFLSWIFDRYEAVPLIPYEDFKVMADAYVAMYPKDFFLPIPQEDLDGYVNETGLNDVDIYSIRNMLSHYHSESWTHKCERMTLIAYRWKQDIHPMAIAFTPTIAAEILGN